VGGGGWSGGRKSELTENCDMRGSGALGLVESGNSKKVSTTGVTPLG